jgi:hypothetical protein
MGTAWMSQSHFEASRQSSLDDCLEYAEQCLLEAQPEPRQFPEEQPRQWMLLTYARICNGFRAVRLLIMNGMGDDALASSRSIVEEGLLLHHLSVVSEADRYKYFLGYMERGINNLLPIIRSGLEWWPEVMQPQIEMLARKSNELKEVKRTIKPKRVPDGTELVRRYLRRDMQVGWKMSQQMIHGSLAALFYRIPDNSGPIEVWGRSSVIEMRETAALAVFALATGHNAMATVYGWPAMPDPVTMSLTVMKLTESQLPE